ncbi:MAG: preprotein translocase subunit SecE [bacterium]
MNRLIVFLKDCKAELLKVSWPNRDEVVAATTAVLIMVAIISLFLYVVDMGLSKVVGSLIY